MVMNRLLASAGGAVLCLHDHGFGHILASQHSEEGGDCHGSEAESHFKSSHVNESDHALFSNSEEPHCVDIVMTATEEPVRRLSDLASVKKPIVTANFSYAQAPVSRAISAAPEMRLAARAPPVSNRTLEQCVRKTVLRI
jgi:hypothetical protein